IHHAVFVPCPYSRFSHSRFSFDGSFELRTNSAHCSSDRPVFSGSSATHFWTIATLGCTSYADFFLAMTGPSSGGRFGSPIRDDRVCLDLDEHVGIYQPAHLDHRRRRADGGEDLAVSAADLLPVRDVRQVHPSADDVFHLRPGLFERGADGLERLD